jgi:acyl carrier protein
MTRPEFYAAIAEMVECEASKVSGATALKDLPNWDSLAVLSFVAMVDSKLGSAVKGTDLVKCETVDDLAALLPGKIEG